MQHSFKLLSFREAEAMKPLDHPNIVRFYGVCETEDSFWIVMEYLNNGSLFGYLEKNENKIDKIVMLDISCQVANGMKYLEEKKVIHRDLAARNVLIGKFTAGSLIVKVGDFGMARKLIGEYVYKRSKDFKFPIKWTAPEVYNSENFTLKSDVWSYGILLWEIFSFGKEPYPGNFIYFEIKVDERSFSEFGKFFYSDKIINGHIMSKPKICPDNIYNDIMKNCWQLNPEKRPTFSSLYSDLSKMCSVQQFMYAKSDTQ